jgi:multidrug efflux pump subunit AcrA (membrane-fusion protein)
MLGNKSMNRRKVISIVFVILFIGIIILAYIAMRAYSGQFSAPLTRGKILESIYANGIITTDRRFAFNPQTVKGIDKIFFKEGDIVTKGMPLMQTTDRIVVRAPFTGIVKLVPYKVQENTYAKESRMERGS